MFFIFYFIVSFICYGTAGAPQLVEAAQANAIVAKMEEATAEDVAAAEKEKASVISEEKRRKVESALTAWTQRGGHLRSGITMETVAQEMNVSRDLLTAWLKTTEWELFTPWLAHLRIEHARLLLQEHPDWTIEVIAEKSGFKSRIYFQQAFKKATQMTPAQYRKKPHPKSL